MDDDKPEKNKGGRPRMYDGICCIFPGCDAPARARRLCPTHYPWWPYHCYLHGDKITERRMHSNGYVEARVAGIWALEHRLFMVRHLGRLLEHSEIIQWVDGDITNNKLDNLILMSRLEKARLLKEAQNASDPAGMEEKN